MDRNISIPKVFMAEYVAHRGYYMAVRRYEISLLALCSRALMILLLIATTLSPSSFHEMFSPNSPCIGALPLLKKNVFFLTGEGGCTQVKSREMGLGSNPQK